MQHTVLCALSVGVFFLSVDEANVGGDSCEAPAGEVAAVDGAGACLFIIFLRHDR